MRPQFVYALAPDCSELCALLARHADQLRRMAERAAQESVEAALAQAYADRLDELCIEGKAMARIGQVGFGAMADARYGRLRSADTASLLALVEARATVVTGPYDAQPTRSDDEGNAGSLLSRMQAAVNEAQLPFRVLVREGMAALAATGDGFIQVAADRWLTAADVERTVCHEIEGHARPFARALALTSSGSAGGGWPGLLRAGTARGSDAQEGWALAWEGHRGHWTAERRQELMARHLATVWMGEGADFVEVVRLLVESAQQVQLEQALRIAGRCYRGAAPGEAGLGRERVYLPAWAELTASLETATVQNVRRQVAWMGRGRIALAYADVFAALEDLIPGVVQDFDVPVLGR